MLNPRMRLPRARDRGSVLCPFGVVPGMLVIVMVPVPGATATNISLGTQPGAGAVQAGRSWSWGEDLCCWVGDTHPVCRRSPPALHWQRILLVVTRVKNMLCLLCCDGW